MRVSHYLLLATTKKTSQHGLESMNIRIKWPNKTHSQMHYLFGVVKFLFLNFARRHLHPDLVLRFMICPRARTHRPIVHCVWTNRLIWKCAIHPFFLCAGVRISIIIRTRIAFGRTFRLSQNKSMHSLILSHDLISQEHKLLVRGDPS